MEEIHNAWQNKEKIGEVQIPKFCKDHFQKVTVLYATFLFAKEPESMVRIKKPFIDSFYNELLKRMSMTNFVKNGSYFDMDPLRQDFMFREVFRLSLAGSIEIVEEDDDEKSVIVRNYSKPSEPELKVDVPEKESFVGDLQTIDDVKPDDSISNFGGRSVIRQETFSATKENKSTVSERSKYSYVSSFSKPKLVRTVKLESSPEEEKMDTHAN